MNEQSPESFVKMPLEFFGQDIVFEDSDEYKDELLQAQAESTEAVKLLLESEPPSKNRDYSEAYTRRHYRENIVAKWYDMRMRGRYDIPLEVRDRHKASFAALQWNSSTELPAVEDNAAFLNDILTAQRWMHTLQYAETWYNKLSEDNPDRKVAADYAGFAGGIILYQYARQAEAMCNPALANDDFLRIKHLITICWPVCRAIEAYAPHEAANKRQLLREIFLECASQSPNNVKRYVDMLSDEILSVRSYEVRKVREKAALSELLKFDIITELEQLQITKLAITKGEKLVQERHPKRALDTLEMAAMAISLPDEQARQLAISTAKQALDAEVVRIKTLGVAAYEDTWNEAETEFYSGTDMLLADIYYHSLFNNEDSILLQAYFEEKLHEDEGEQLGLF